ncbi:hypothetical protein AX774_g7127 [Zancudomyces culisetae]|uniref:Uncharacterized protein n=1 Tax=Zancudomyces culisetae TaxID=1213189 RepID=A0A1R1PF07_ZANCU|nr:hypothetical protein AX774_g7127 [Zancudomyces culisetae]|eukprot:OMH79462.1 hypothetical protein AX774_g7127 [Zancudomyces culisetae]
MQNEISAAYIARRHGARNDAMNILKDGKMFIYKKSSDDVIEPDFFVNVEWHHARYASEVNHLLGFRMSECITPITHTILDEMNNILGFIRQLKPRPVPQDESSDEERSLPPHNPVSIWNVFNTIGLYAFTISVTEMESGVRTVVFNYRFRHLLASTVSNSEIPSAPIRLYAADEDSSFGNCSFIDDLGYNIRRSDSRTLVDGVESNSDGSSSDGCEEHLVFTTETRRMMAILTMDTHYNNTVIHFNQDFRIRGYSSLIQPSYYDNIGECPFPRGEQELSTLEQRAAIFSLAFYRELFYIMREEYCS